MIAIARPIQVPDSKTVRRSSLPILRPQSGVIDKLIHQIQTERDQLLDKRKLDVNFA